MEIKTINVSTATMLKVIAIVLGLWFLYLVRDVLALLFLSVILTATFDSPVDFMARHKIPRPLGVLIIYAVMLLIVGLLFSFLVPPLIGQFQEFANELPGYVSSFENFLNNITRYAQSHNIEFNTSDFLLQNTGGFFQSSNQIFSTTVGVFSFFISVVVVLALTFYMLVKEDGMNKFLLFITPKAQQSRIISIADSIKKKVGNWLAGQLLLMVIIFFLDFIALSIFKVKYALALAILAGLLEIVPYLGPIISIGLASVVGFLISPVTGLMVLGILTIIQQIESNIIVPQLMKKVVALNPILVILALMIGIKLGGVMGAILSVPIATSVNVVFNHFFDQKETTEENIVKV